MCPKAQAIANGITRIRKISKMLVNAVGFSNGCAELTLKKPPPLVPSSLIASWLATGPVVSSWLPPVSVVIGLVGEQRLDRAEERPG